MDLQQAAEICKVLSDPHRLTIMKLLVDGEKCASELLQSFSIRQPTLSHHMKALTESQLLTERKVGKRTYYAISWTPSAMRPTGTRSLPFPKQSGQSIKQNRRSEAPPVFYRLLRYGSAFTCRKMQRKAGPFAVSFLTLPNLPANPKKAALV